MHVCDCTIDFFELGEQINDFYLLSNLRLYLNYIVKVISNEIIL